MSSGKLFEAGGARGRSQRAVNPFCKKHAGSNPAPPTKITDPLFRARFYCWRAWSDHVGLWFACQIAPASRLMTRGDQGRVALVGFAIDLGFGWAREIVEDQQMYRHWYRPRLWFRVRSDAREISLRLAKRAGA